MKPISLTRFNALAGYARQPMTWRFAEEISWFEHDSGRVVGGVIRDRTDNDFAGVILAQDRRLRFRAVKLTEFKPTARRAEALLRPAMDAAALAPPEEHYQGDEHGPIVDFFAFTRPSEQLHPSFVSLTQMEVYSPAREIIEPMMRWYDDADGNFVEQFQTTGFDQRVWELYLFATLTEIGCQLDRTHAAPDFNCSRFGFEFAVEAVTVGPTMDGGIPIPPPSITTPKQRQDFLDEYMPIKFGSPLFSKLRRRYWEHEHVAGRPFLIAIVDFSAPASMVYTSTSLDTYLYGYAHDWSHGDDGSLLITPRKVEYHRWGDKVIPSGFFNLDGAENVSAVLFSNSGTVAKFNRMGRMSKFGSNRVAMVREGICANHDPNATEPLPFKHSVEAEEYWETWIEGLHVFHNPRAAIPLPEHTFPGAAHHYLLEDKQRLTILPEWHPISSVTQHYIQE